MLPGLGVLWETGKRASPSRNTSADGETQPAALLGQPTGYTRPGLALRPQGWRGRESHACRSSATSPVTRCHHTWPSPNALPALTAHARCAPAGGMRAPSHAAVGSRGEGGWFSFPWLSRSSSPWALPRWWELTCAARQAAGAWPLAGEAAGSAGGRWAMRWGADLAPISLLSLSLFRHSSPWSLGPSKPQAWFCTGLQLLPKH